MRLTSRGPFYALVAALLFGASTPFSKILLKSLEPTLLAGLLYLGSGTGLTLCVWFRRRSKKNASEAQLRSTDLPWLAGATLSGGVIGPLLLLIGLRVTPASSSSLLLNLEGVFTAVIAWFVFKENFDRRIVLGMCAIVASGVLVSWSGRPSFGVQWGPIAIAGACLSWAVDNNLTRNVSAGDPLQVAAVKGLVAGTVNLIISVMLGVSIPSFVSAGIATVIGFLAYGVSLALFVLSLREVGTARTGAYFSIAPFVGALLSIVILKEAFTIYFFAATILMLLGVWLHLTERHEHGHWHEAFEHDHRHSHDEHHQHHDDQTLLAETHAHMHRHGGLFHAHPHYPDIHHRHEH